MKHLLSVPLDNYRQLLSRVDELCQRIETDFRQQISCHKGCDACCRHLSLFWVEGIAMAQALRSLGSDRAAQLRRRVRQAATGDACPLLEDGACLLYGARPIICRTHGLPMLAVMEGERRVDFCPRNFRGVEALPAAALVNLEVLNATLATINALFVDEAFGGEPPASERLSIAEALLLPLG